MSGNIPGGTDILAYDVSEKIFDQILNILVVTEGEKKGYVII